MIVSILNNAELFEINPFILLLATTPTFVTLTVCVVSKSTTLNVPFVVKVVFVSLRFALSLFPLSTVITGISFVPIRFTTNVFVSIL